MKILYGTTNQAKLDSMKRLMDILDIEIIGLKDLGKEIPEVNEIGNNLLENAILKAKAFYKAYQIPVFSCDSGLYFEELEESLQPGTHVRRVNNKSLSDEEMIEYYANLAKRYDNHLIGSYRNAICFIYDKEHIYKCFDDSIATDSFLMVSTPHEKRVSGFPIDSLSVDLSTKKYYYDLPDQSVDDSSIYQGFKHFFVNSLGKIRDK